MKIKNSNAGFTLMEFTLVFGLITLMAVFTIVVIDPARRIGNARNSLRNSDAQNILRAINAYALDNDALPTAITSLTNNTNYMIAAAGDTAGGTVNCAAVGDVTKVDISNGTSALFNYLATMPVDPEQTAPYTNGTGYYFRKNGNVIVDVKPCNVYVDPTVPLPPPPAITGIAFPGYGSEATIDTLDTAYVDIDTIDSTHAIMMYEKYTKVLTINGTNITANSRSTAASTNDEASITYLTTNKVVAGFNATIGPNTITNIGTTSANPTTWAGAQNMNSVLPRYVKIKTLDSTHVIIAYADNTNGNAGKVRVGTVGATTITWGTEATFNANYTGVLGLSILDSTHFVVTYMDNTDSKNGNARVGSISGTTISWDTDELSFDTDNNNAVDSVALDSSKFIVIYTDNDTGKPYSIVCSVSAPNITCGTPVLLSNTTTQTVRVEKIDSTHAILVYSANAINTAKADIATISGNELTILASPVAFEAGAILFPSVTLLDANNFVIGYQDVTGSGYAKAIVGTITWQ